MNLGFALDSATRRQLGYMVVDRINEYFDSLSHRPVQQPLETRNLRYVRDPIPEDEENAETVLSEAFEELFDRGFHIGSANYLGLMNPTPTFISVLAEMLVAAINPQLASVERSAAASRIEKETIDWIAQRLGLPQCATGAFTTGGSEANSSALNLALVNLDAGVIKNGLAHLGAPAVFYVSGEGHHSLDKAAGILGLGREAVRKIGVTDRLRMDPVQLEECIRTDKEAGKIPFCVVGTAGTTNTGAIDDLGVLAAIAKKHRLWFHVDGAFGAAVVFSDQHRTLVDGIELADSVTVDPHKWLAMPFSAGVLLTRHPDLLRVAYSTSAPYLRHSTYEGLEDSFQMSTQWSRRMNSLKLWMTLRIHGRKSYESMIAKQMELAEQMAQWVTNSTSFELCAPRVLTAVAFRVKLQGCDEEEIAAANEIVVEHVNRSGERWISLTTVAGRSAIRTMVISYLTAQSHVADLQRALAEAAEHVLDTENKTRASLVKL